MEMGQRDPRAEIEAVYRRRYGKFLRVAVAILRDEQLAEEAVHDGFVRALRHWRGFDERGSLEAWLWRIVVNEARRRRSVERPSPLSLLLPPVGSASASASANSHCEGSPAEATVAAGPDRQR